MKNLSRHHIHLLYNISLGVLLFFICSTALAQDAERLKVNLITPFNSGSETVTTTDSFTSYFTRAIPLIFAFAGVAAVVQIVIGGIQYAVSGLNPGQLSDAQDRMRNAVYGLLLALGSYLLLNTLDPRLVNLNLSFQDLDGSATPSTNTETQFHTECRAGACTPVPGRGDNTCDSSCGVADPNNMPSGTLNTTSGTVFCISTEGHCTSGSLTGLCSPPKENLGVDCRLVLQRCTKPGDRMWTSCNRDNSARPQ